MTVSLFLPSKPRKSFSIGLSSFATVLVLVCIPKEINYFVTVPFASTFQSQWVAMRPGVYTVVTFFCCISFITQSLGRSGESSRCKTRIKLPYSLASFGSALLLHSGIGFGHRFTWDLADRDIRYALQS